MELRHLRYFVAVAEELHFTRAAERLHIGQPPLSQQIRLLEEEIGAKLLERNRRWVRLTEAGKLFLDDARRILTLSEQAAATARQAEQGQVGELRIGFTASTPLTDVFNRVISTYRKQFPMVTLSLFEMHTVQQLEEIEDRTIDLGFIRPPELDVPKGIEMTTLCQERLVMIAPAHHPLLNQSTISIKDLAPYPFVTFLPHAGTGIEPQVVRLCRASGFDPIVALQAGEGTTIIGLVAAGCGISILPESFAGIQVKGSNAKRISYCPLVDAGAVTQLVLATRNGTLSPLAHSFSELAERVSLDAS